MSGEFDRIRQIRARAARRQGAVVLGIGDDAALLRPMPGCEIAFASDLSVEGVHFRLDWTTPRALGRKALAVSLSDLAAMGAVPRAALIGLALPAWANDAFVDSLYDGILELADASGVVVAGGDLSSTPGPLVIDAVVLGDVEAGRALRRSGARESDDLWVSGELGSSAAGLRALLAGTRREDAEPIVRANIAAHLAPEPRLALGRALVSRGLASAAIDVSDGLSSDLGHLCRESGVGALVDAAALPTSGDVEDALHGGEQYELLFASAHHHREALADLAGEICLPLTRIGRFEGATVIVARGDDVSLLKPRGWDHFNSGSAGER